MNTPQRKLVGGMLVLTISCLTAAVAGHAQSTKPARPPPIRPIRRQRPAWTPNAPRSGTARTCFARAWLQEYCATSKNVKPGEAQQYLDELEHMSPIQMKLWLMKFDEEEDQKKQQRAFYQQAQSTLMRQAKSSDRATQKSYGEIETEETAAANQEQGQLNEEEANEQQNQDDKQLGPYTPYGQGAYPGAGGIHYHFHLYPY